MRDPSEVIAEMRDCERHVQVFGWPRAIRQWADELAATLPASTPPGDAEVLRLRQGYWDARAIMGFDNDGAPTPAARVSDFVAMMLSDARSMRADYDEAIAEQSASVVGLSDDPCVRHACKRVRMEMQARIDALSQRAEVDGAMVDELLALAEGAEADRAEAIGELQSVEHSMKAGGQTLVTYRVLDTNYHAPMRVRLVPIDAALSPTASAAREGSK